MFSLLMNALLIVGPMLWPLEPVLYFFCQILDDSLEFQRLIYDLQIVVDMHILYLLIQRNEVLLMFLLRYQ